MNQQTQAAAKQRTQVPGYQPVLVRADLKEKLKAFRRQNGMEEQLHERTLVSAALEICLTSPDLADRWKEAHRVALMRDLGIGGGV